MELVLRTSTDATVDTNVSEVVQYCKSMLEKYRGCVATKETLRDDKRVCADINRLKKFVSDQRIAFMKRIMSCQTVENVVSSMKAIESLCDEVRDPYWASVKEIEDADKPKEEKMDECWIILGNVLPSEVLKVFKYVENYLPGVTVRKA
jgi:hypothetical protein